MCDGDWCAPHPYIYLGSCAQHTLEPHPCAPIATIAAAAVTTVATASVAVAVVVGIMVILTHPKPMILQVLFSLIF